MIAQKSIINILKNNYKMNTTQVSKILRTTKLHAEMLLAGKEDFTTGEIIRLCNCLDIPDEKIFSENAN